MRTFILREEEAGLRTVGSLFLGQPPPGTAGQHRLSSAGVETTLKFTRVQMVSSWCDAASVSLLRTGASSRHEFGSIKIARSCPLETAPLVSPLTPVGGPVHFK